MIEIRDNIAYEDGKPIVLHIIEIEPCEGYQLLATFQDGTAKLYDVTHLLDKPVFKVLKQPEIFRRVVLDRGVPTWEKENIDISPESIYANGVTVAL